MQTEMPLFGLTSPPSPHMHPAAEIRACQTFQQAIRRSLMHAGMTQEAVADRMPVTQAMMSQYMTGKREMTVSKMRKLWRITGSYATLQWLAQNEGMEVYADELAIRQARAEAELAEIRALRAA